MWTTASCRTPLPQTVRGPRFAVAMTTKKRVKRHFRRRPGRPGRPDRHNRPKSRPTASTSTQIPSTTEQPSAGARLPGRQRLVDVPATSELFSQVLTDHPLIFLLRVSQLYAALDEFADDPTHLELHDLPVGAERSEHIGIRAATFAMSRLVGRRSVRQAFNEDHLGGRADFPTWLRFLEQSEITGCWCGYNEDDLDDVLGVGIRFADGQEGTLVTVTEGQTGSFVDARLSLVPYAETALSWIRHNPATVGLSKINEASAAATLRQAVRCSDPVDSEGISERADWVLGRLVIEWVISLLAGTSNSH